MLPFEIEIRNGTPVYEQIALAAKKAILAGRMKPDDAFPSVRAISRALRVNPNTVQRAYDELAREGLIYARRGKGLFVAEEGAVAAQTRAQQGVRRAFEQGIRTGRAAGMRSEQLRSIFEASMGDGAETGK